MARSAIQDNPGQTILVVETVKTEPHGQPPAISMYREESRWAIDLSGIFGGNHRRGANVVAVDGTPLFLPPDISPTMLDAWLHRMAASDWIHRL